MGGLCHTCNFAEAIFSDELKDTKKEVSKNLCCTFTFCTATWFQSSKINQDVTEEGDDESKNSDNGLQTRTGIAIPFADPSVGAGVFAQTN